MESTIVIKTTSGISNIDLGQYGPVKYGETLRRFNALIVDRQLDLDMDGLREKILCLFNFAPNADLMLAYIDEDGDVVTLVDEEDLRDVMRQALNPLRITVSLNNEKSGRSYARSSGSSTPMRSPRIQSPLPNLNTGVSEIMKSIPEPVREALSKLSFDLASKATSSAPGLVAELVDGFTKMGLTYLNQVSELQAGAESSTQAGASLSTMGASVTKNQKGSKVEGATSEKLPNAGNEEPTPKGSQVDLVNVSSGVEASVLAAPGPVNVDVGLPVDNFLFGGAFPYQVPGIFHDAVDENKEEVKKLGECHSSGLANTNATPVATNVPTGNKNKEVKKKLSERYLGQNSVGVGPYTSPLDYLRHCTLDSQNTNLSGGVKTKFSSDSGNSSGSRFDPNPISECLLTGTPVANDPTVLPPHYASRVVPFKRSYNYSDGIGSIFHRGVRCDGCGVHPITGPRFKSKVKEDYDLCSICFAAMGNEADYIRMDRPMTHHQPKSFKGLYDPMHHSRLRPPTLPPIFRGCGMKPSRPRLDSRFIQDVNILDGTIMTPSTPFTKIWRMRNNGTIVWPQGTQLLWIGGDRLSNTLSVNVEIPVDGLPVDKELDIAVDFTAPELPGRYISYWRMALPSGQKFGQRVWVLIQVDIDASLKDSWCESMHGLNLNLPPVSSGKTGPEIVDVNVEPMDDSPAEPDNSNMATELVEPIVYSHPNKNQELNFPINDTLLVGGGISIPVPPQTTASVSYPIIDFSEVSPALPSPGRFPTVNGLAPADQVVSGNSDVEQTLLNELEEMGFKQVDLNKEILRMNEYNLELSVDDLCGVAEWDPILDELQEMGFCDKEVNKKLLKKNNGSIKRVVMDLIAGEEA